MTRSLFLALVVVGSCGLEREHPPFLEHEGEPCLTARARCLGQGVGEILICTNRTWTKHDCDAVCAEGGTVAVGCTEPGGCECEPEPGACAAGTRRCVDAGAAVENCEQGEFVRAQCETVCDSLGLNSAGCLEGDGVFRPSADCYCTGEGISCGEDGEVRCAGPASGTCFQGQWQFEVCPDTCEGGYCDVFGDQECACP